MCVIQEVICRQCVCDLVDTVTTWKILVYTHSYVSLHQLLPFINMDKDSHSMGITEMQKIILFRLIKAQY